jgi:hypothetical protein
MNLRGRIGAMAVGTVEAFIIETNGLCSSGELAQSWWTDLINATNSVIEQLQAA